MALCFVVTSCMHSRAGLCLSYYYAQGNRCSTMCAWPTPPDLGGSDQVCRLHFVVCLHARMLARLYACIDVLSACMCASPVFFSVLVMSSDFPRVGFLACRCPEPLSLGHARNVPTCCCSRRHVAVCSYAQVPSSLSVRSQTVRVRCFPLCHTCLSQYAQVLQRMRDYIQLAGDKDLETGHVALLRFHDL